MNKFISQFSKRQLVFLILTFIIISINSFQLTRYLLDLNKIKKLIGIQFPGYKFAGLEEILRDEKYVGYYTDKDLKEDGPLKQFSQAQYVLAPIVLDSDNLDHAFVLFDCSSKEVALQKIREIKAVPFKMNQFGIVLAKRL